ncbi:RsiV family protein [Neobacillus niacini]|uniref:RsiV family protein n=1 Tax=Neobacillus niacini TaxID=86668 RepID=UPI0005ED9297|nr:RsiV family protein [Neobacillus niacini]
MDKKLEALRIEYKNTPIPDDLDFIVKKALKQKTKKNVNKMKRLIGIGAAALIFITGINASPNLANALSEVPIVGSLIKVLTFTEFKVDEETAKMEIKVPAITNMENKTLESTLNKKYLAESKKLYNDFMAEIEEVKKNGGGHLGVESGYDVKTDNDQILAVGRYVVSTVNSYSEYTYDTVDKKNELLIILPSLFKDDSYMNLINENIKEQMRLQMDRDPDKFYWLDDEMGFKTIAKDQSFYINDEGKLIIVFNKYEVAPGYMGVCEFTIPTDVISNALASKEYIK